MPEKICGQQVLLYFLAMKCFILILSVAFSFAAQSQTRIPAPVLLRNSPRHLSPTVDLDRGRGNTSQLDLAKPRHLLFQFDEIPDANRKLALRSLGITLLHYIPSNTYLVNVSRNLTPAELTGAGIIGMGELSPMDKMDSALDSIVLSDKNRAVWVQFFASTSLEEAITAVSGKGGIVDKTLFDEFAILTVAIPGQLITSLAAEDIVENISPVTEPEFSANEGGIQQSRANILQGHLPGNYNLSGKGITVGVFELRGSPFTHVDFAQQILLQKLPKTNDAHSTHVHGTLVGSGLLNPNYAGFAPAAKTLSADGSVTSLTNSNYHRHYNMVLTNNSYGSGFVCSAPAYTTLSRIIDKQSIDYPTLLHVFAAGNSGWETCARYPSGFHTVGMNQNSAKATLSVGNITDDGKVYGSSSKGPGAGGRLKPEVVAVGSNVWSTLPGNTYGPNWGTSMAAPAVTGGLALLYERYRQLHNGEFPAGVLMKAIVCNTADDIGNPGPDFSHGYGALNLLRAVRTLDDQRYFHGSVGLDKVEEKSIQIPAHVKQLKVLLYWADPPATPLSTKALINDLDLVVKNQAGTGYLPLVLDTVAANVDLVAGPGVDRINCHEQVVIEHPPAGNYTVAVSGTSITEGDSQGYYVVYEFVKDSLQLDYPAGGELVSPGETLLIRWNTAMQEDPTLLTYSADGGYTWSAIGNSLPSSYTYEWTIPDTLSNEVLVRVQQPLNNQLAQSLFFSIIPVPVLTLTADQCPGSAGLSWSTLPGIDSFVILKAVGGSMQEIGITQSTSFQVSNLLDDSTYFFSVAAIHNGKRGRRSPAVTRKPDSGNCEHSLFEHDLRVIAIVSPATGRKETSSQLSAATAVTVRLENSGKNTVQGILLQYRIGGGSYISEETYQPILPGEQLDFTFSERADLVDAGHYDIEVVARYAMDINTTNDTARQTIRHLANAPMDLSVPYQESFENADQQELRLPVMGIRSLERFDLISGHPFNRVNLQHTNFIDSFSHALVLSSSSIINEDYNEVTATFNLSGFHNSSHNITCNLTYYQSAMSVTPRDSLWIRGSDTQPWIPVLNLSRPIGPETVHQVKQLDFGQALSQAGQDFSSSFQLLWRQKGTGASYAIDNLNIINSSRDMGVLSVASPAISYTRHQQDIPVQVRVANYSSTAQDNVSLWYQLDNRPAVQTTLTQIAGHSELLVTFPEELNNLTIGKHHFRVWTALPGDTYPANDQQAFEVMHYPVIDQFPYLEQFEENNGNYYAAGQTSFEHGEIGFGTIFGAASKGKGWKTNLHGSYKVNEKGYLYSPVFDVSGLQRPMLSFSLASQTDLCVLTTYCDMLSIQYTRDGINWLPLPASAQSYNYITHINSPDGFRWQVSTTGLPTGMQRFQFRLYFRSDDRLNFEGIAIDDIHLYENGPEIFYGNANATIPTAPGGMTWENVVVNDQLFAQWKRLEGSAPATAVVSSNVSPGNFHGQVYLERTFTMLHPGSDSFTLRLYIQDAEMLRLLQDNTCATCFVPVNPYRVGISVYQSDSTNEINSLISDNLHGKWIFLDRDKLHIVPYQSGYYVELKTVGNVELRISNGGMDNRSALPVNINQFTGKPVDGGLRLEWETPAEINIHEFEMEVAVGKTDFLANNFSKTGTVSSLGKSTTTQQYSFHYAPQTQEVHYFRIRPVDINGQKSISESISIPVGKQQQFVVYPNPSTGNCILSYFLPLGEKAELMLYDVSGRQLARHSIEGAGIWVNYPMNMGPELQKGIYLMKIKTASTSTTLKLVRH
ncbi:MAG: S8 family serine peptidase [Chitinophagaceae bacterium]